jgi:hypothetical protein
MIVLLFFSSFSSIETSVERKRRKKKDEVNEERAYRVIEYHPHQRRQQRCYASSRKTFYNDSLCIPRSFLAIYSCIITDKKKKVFIHSSLLSLYWSPSLMSYTRRQCRMREKRRENRESGNEIVSSSRFFSLLLHHC